MPLYPGTVLRSDIKGMPFTAGGEAVRDRTTIIASTNSTVSGFVFLTHFEAQRTETITELVAYTSTQAAATITLIRYCVYSQAANGDLTLVASTPNDDLTLLTAMHTRYPKDLSVAWNKVAGQIYAEGLLFVGTTPALMYSLNNTAASTVNNIFKQSPVAFSQLGGQTDLPASIPNASVAASRMGPYMEMFP